MRPAVPTRRPRSARGLPGRPGRAWFPRDRGAPAALPPRGRQFPLAEPPAVPRGAATPVPLRAPASPPARCGSHTRKRERGPAYPGGRSHCGQSAGPSARRPPDRHVDRGLMRRPATLRSRRSGEWRAAARRPACQPVSREPKRPSTRPRARRVYRHPGRCVPYSARPAAKSPRRPPRAPRAALAGSLRLPGSEQRASIAAPTLA